MSERPDRPDVLYAPFVWQETGTHNRGGGVKATHLLSGVEHHETLSGPVQIVFAHGSFLAKKVRWKCIRFKVLPTTDSS